MKADEGFSYKGCGYAGCKDKGCAASGCSCGDHCACTDFPPAGTSAHDAEIFFVQFFHPVRLFLRGDRLHPDQSVFDIIRAALQPLVIFVISGPQFGIRGKRFQLQDHQIDPRPVFRFAGKPVELIEKDFFVSDKPVVRRFLHCRAHDLLPLVKPLFFQTDFLFFFGVRDVIFHQEIFQRIHEAKLDRIGNNIIQDLLNFLLEEECSAALGPAGGSRISVTRPSGTVQKDLDIFSRISGVFGKGNDKITDPDNIYSGDKIADLLILGFFL